MKIFDQFKRLLKRPEKKPDRRRLGAAPLMDSYRDYVADGLTPERLAAILKEADAGDLSRQAELFEQIEERDGHLQGEMSKRKNVILDAEFDLAPASEDSRDVKVYEDVKAWLEGITQWEDILTGLQDAVGKGFAVFDLPWDVSEGQARVVQFDWLRQKRFRFVDKAGLLTDVPLLITDDDPMGVEIPPWRVMMHTYGGLSGHPTRAGIYRICAWNYIIKHYSIKDWMAFAEVYGMPLRLGKYDTAASKDDIDALMAAVLSIGHDAAGVISKATEIEFPASGDKKASSDLFERLAAMGNKEMSKAILGGTLTADVDGKGSYAAANTHNDVRHDLIHADARAMASTIRNQLIRPYVGFNFGWDTAVPKYTGRFFKEDLATLEKTVDTLADRMDIPESWVREKFGIPEPEKGEKVLRPKTGQNSPSIQTAALHTASLPNRTRNEFLEFTDMVSEDLESSTDRHIQNWLKPVKKIMAASTSLDEFRDKLLDAFWDMDPEPLGVLIEQAMTAANLGGRFEVDTDG